VLEAESDDDISFPRALSSVLIPQPIEIARSTVLSSRARCFHPEHG